MMTPFFTNNSCNPFDPSSMTCTMGDYVHYAVNVSTVAHVQATIAFAQRHNIRFVIRNTGHDFMGKSTGYGALSIWTHYVTGMEIVNFSDDFYTGPAVKAMAGTQVGDLYDFTHAAGYAVIGGECSTVGWSGGYTSGGGHSALTSWKGLAADQTLEFEVILADGRLVTASRSENSDLWWALSGGGPGNYGIVWSLTSKVYPDIIVTGANIFVPQGNATDAAFWEFM
jgi:FAD/FMN-containing dehydrogenase